MGKNTDKLFGLHAVQQVLKTKPDSILNVWLQHASKSSGIISIQKSLEQFGIAAQLVPRVTLDKLSHHGNHQGVLLEIRAEASTGDETDLDTMLSTQQDPFYLILDSFQDPHNLGACIRTAEVVGVHAVVIPKDREVPVNATVRKIASGAVEYSTIIRVTNLVRVIKKMQAAGIWVVGTSAEANQSLYTLDLTVPTAIVMGSEAKGIRAAVAKQCDYMVALPIMGKTSSLNVSVATGVVLYEVLRQRAKGKAG